VDQWGRKGEGELKSKGKVGEMIGKEWWEKASENWLQQDGGYRQTQKRNTCRRDLTQGKKDPPHLSDADKGAPGGSYNRTMHRDKQGGKVGISKEEDRAGE